MRRHRQRQLAVAALFALAVAPACTKHTEEQVETETVVTVKTAPAALGTIRGVVHATGVINPAPGADLVVVAPEAARIAEIPPAAGDRVRRGDLLVRFEIPSSAAEVEKQQAEVVRAEAGVGTATAAEVRARELFERGVAARKEVEDAARGVADAKAALAQARASLAASQAIARRSIVRATFDGLVAKRQHNPGDLVEASAGDPVLRVVDPSRLEVVASVPLADSARIEVGAPGHLAMTPAGADDVPLKVISRPTAVEAGTATVPVRLGFTGAGGLPVGSPVQVDIDAELHHGVVLVPAVAVVREGEEAAVFVAAGNKAKRRVVQIGLADGRNVEIRSGVNAGEMVIVDGQAGLPDDAAITVAGDAGTASEGARGAEPAKGAPK